MNLLSISNKDISLIAFPSRENIEKKKNGE